MINRQKNKGQISDSTIQNFDKGKGQDYCLNVFSVPCKIYWVLKFIMPLAKVYFKKRFKLKILL